MSNEQPHINPWAEKLQQTPMPDANASWKGMERLLDQHLPVAEKEKKRRFFFILFPVMLLVIGLVLLGSYLYTASKQQVNQHPQAAGNSDVRVTGVDTSNSLHPIGVQAPANSRAAASAKKNVSAAIAVDTVMAGSTSSIKETKPHAADAIKEAPLAKSKTTSVKELTSPNNNLTAKHGSSHHKEKATIAKTDGTSLNRTTKTGAQSELAKDNSGTVVKRAKGKRSNRKEAYRNGEETSVSIPFNKRKDRDANALAFDRNKTTAAIPTPVAGNSSLRTQPLPAFRKPINPLQQLVLKDSINQLRSSVLLDSVLQAMKKKGDEWIKKGWTFGVGVNHFVRINSQQPAPYKGDAATSNSEGLTGKITDYLPVPQAQYHFNNKLFVQGELQFNAPQFTQPVQLEHRNYSDGVFNITDTAYLKKLTYFNLPLSIHYSPVKHFYIGAGVQFARLNNAVVLHEKTSTRGGSQFPDSSFKSSKQERIKDDTLFQKLHTSELRLLADASYQLGAFGIGVRYNYALRNLVKVPVVGGTITQARNSSLQLYIRYRFLDKRKRIQPGSK